MKVIIEAGNNLSYSEVIGIQNVCDGQLTRKKQWNGV